VGKDLARSFAASLPGPLKRQARSAYADACRRVLAWQRRRSAPGEISFTLAEVLNFLYPAALPEDLHLDGTALAAAGSLRVRDLGAVRRVLAALDGPSAPSPVQIRFGPSDVAHVDINGVTLVLDSADSSVAQEIIAEHRYEPDVTALLEDLLDPGMTFVDIGANVGYHALLGARLVGPTGRVFAVEPFSENCRAILMSIAASGIGNVTLLPVALDDHQGWSHMSTHIGSNASIVSDQVDQIARGYGTIVPTFRLDQLVTGPIDVIKIDGEGAEARAVRGATELISTWRPKVITEVSEEMLERVSASSVRSYVEWFTTKGYSISLLDREGGPPLQVGDLDSFLRSWTDHLRVENLLLAPR